MLGNIIFPDWASFRLKLSLTDFSKINAMFYVVFR